MLGYVTILVITAIIFCMYAIWTFKVTVSASTSALAYIYFLRVALNSWEINDVACFTFEVLVCPVACDTPRESSPVVYTPPPVIEVSSTRIYISSNSRSRASDAPPSRELS